MPRRRRSSELQRDVGGFVGAGVTLGIGSGIAAAAGGGAIVGPAFATAGGLMAPVGAAMMAKHAFKQVKKFPKSKISLKYKKPRR